MVTKNKLIIFLIFMCAVNFTVISQSNNKPIRIGLMTDMQYADKENGKTRFYRASLSKTEEAVKHINESKVSFSIILGDFVDEGPKDINSITKILSKLDSPYYGVLGNHDYPQTVDNHILDKFNLPAPYYSLETGNWKLIFLNTNELALYSMYTDKAKEKEYNKLVQKSKKHTRNNVYPWNGGVSKKQLKWLKKELAKAKQGNKKAIIFTHHPLLPENGLEALNNRDIIKLLSDYDIVKAVFSGHNHEGSYANSNNIHYIALEGMIETPDESAHGIMLLYNDSIIIKGNGRMTSRELTL